MAPSFSKPAKAYHSSSVQRDFYEASKKPGMEAAKLMKKFGMKQSTAYRWFSNAKAAETFDDFNVRMGRPPLISDPVVERLKGKFVELTEGRRTPSVKNSDKRGSGIANIIQEELDIEMKEDRMLFMEELSEKQVYDQCRRRFNFRQYSAVTKTDARLQAICDVKATTVPTSKNLWTY